MLGSFVRSGLGPYYIKIVVNIGLNKLYTLYTYKNLRT